MSYPEFDILTFISSISFFINFHVFHRSPFSSITIFSSWFSFGAFFPCRETKLYFFSCFCDLWALLNCKRNSKRAVMISDIDLAYYHVVGIIQIPASVKLQVTLYIMDLWCQSWVLETMMSDPNVPGFIA